MLDLLSRVERLPGPRRRVPPRRGTLRYNRNANPLFTDGGSLPHIG